MNNPFINYDSSGKEFTKHIDFIDNSLLVAQNCRVSANGKVIIKDFPL